MVKKLAKPILIACAVVICASSFIFSKEIASVYKVDAAQSSVKWIGKKVTGEHSGNVTISSGSLSTTNNAVTAGTVEIDLTTITNTDITDPASNAKLLGHLKSADFFNVASFPKATLVITSSKVKSAGTYDVTGNLTIKGITQPITFPATIQTTADKINATAVLTIDRTKYDIKYRSASFFSDLGDKAIDNDFVLNVKLVANKSNEKL